MKEDKEEDGAEAEETMPLKFDNGEWYYVTHLSAGRDNAVGRDLFCRYCGVFLTSKALDEKVCLCIVRDAFGVHRYLNRNLPQF